MRHPFFPGPAAYPAADTPTSCAAIVGAFAEILDAHRRGVRPQRAVFVMRAFENPQLRPEERDQLWDLFAVTVLTVLVDAEGVPAGFECEAQDGLHVSTRLAEALGLPEAGQTLCNCGRPGPRLMAGAATPRRAHAVQPPFLCRA